MALKFKVADIPPEGMEIPLNLSAAQAKARMSRSEAASLGVAAPLAGRLKLEPTGRRVVVRGSVSTLLRADCARCLEEFERPAAEQIFVVMTPMESGAGPEELDAAAVSQDYYTGEEIDLWPVIVEHLVLGLPIKSLCREDCQGLCPVCGRNRNHNSCDCSTQTGHPGLAALKEIRNKLPEKS